jgi:hypothetical protein
MMTAATNTILATLIFFWSEQTAEKERGENRRVMQMPNYRTT